LEARGKIFKSGDLVAINNVSSDRAENFYGVLLEQLPQSKNGSKSAGKMWQVLVSRPVPKSMLRILASSHEAANIITVWESSLVYLGESPGKN